MLALVSVAIVVVSSHGADSAPHLSGGGVFLPLHAKHSRFHGRALLRNASLDVNGSLSVDESSPIGKLDNKG